MRSPRCLAWLAAGAAVAAAIALSGAPAGAADATPTPSPRPSAAPSPSAEPGAPTTPPNVQLCPPPVPAGTTQGYVGLCWSASTDDVGVTGYEVYRLTANGFVRATTTTGTTVVMGGLAYGQVYTFYIVAKDADGHTSPPTALINARAVTGMVVSPSPVPGDTTPPSKPSGLRDGCVYDWPGTAFCWTASTDDVGVAGYAVYRLTSTGWLAVGTRSSTYFMEGNLTTYNKYTYIVVAIDTSSNVSVPSDPFTTTALPGLPTPTPSVSPSPSPSPSATPGCKVAYSQSTWNTGLTAGLVITNTGTTPISGWTLRFTFPSAGERLDQGWSADWSQGTGTAVTASNLAWNATLAPGASVSIGFNASHTGVSDPPSAFSLNGAPCTKA
ncbi:cellulose binding domain-containing protein [Microbispora sp. NBC_01189]|uniref:cellulose binding domain-containing protein n=1 Tax=Microbispora sp. NBC_01189 TaxID=2903583 RepID=UPI002E0EC5E7|nr:cellulose binding domain-containing protein [Microbispora sp. NBC_01189]